MSSHSAPPPSSTTVDSDPTTVHLILTGASGYLGQHLLAQWITHGVLPPSSSSSVVQFQITALYHKSESFPSAVKEFREQNPQRCGISGVTVRSFDLTDRGHIDSLVESTKGAAAVVVVHSAALSSPRACQADPEVAKAINVPKSFLDAFSSTSATPASILALSTDQVYDGKQPSGSLYTEDETKGLNPVNVYGRTKLELEDHLSKSSSAVSVALRSSIILGPPAPIDPACAHGTFLDFCQSRGHAGEATTFFTNEYRSVVRVDKVASTLSGLVARCLPTTTTPSTSLPSKVYNMGGPFRVNRMELAAAVFDKFGYDPSLLLEAEQTSPMSPLDISMDSSGLFQDGILDESKGQEPNASEAYLKDLVDYVFGV